MKCSILNSVGSDVMLQWVVIALIFLIQCSKFNDDETKIERRKFDNFALTRDIWDCFAAACYSLFVKKWWTITGIQKQCSFRNYILNKPATYDIRIEMMCNIANKFIVYSVPYTVRTIINIGGLS